MNIVKLAVAAAITLSSFALPALPAAAAQRDRDRWEQNDGRRDARRHDNRRHRGWRNNNGRHRGWRNNHRRQVCRWVWRHHHRTRVCRWYRWRR